jgi:Mg2+-importing ATPase
MTPFETCIKTTEEVLRMFDSDPEKGLASEQVARAQQVQGTNEIKAQEVRWWQVLLRQFKSSFVYLLVGASLISWFFGEHLDAMLIAAFILINSGIGFAQEYRSELTIKSLKKFTVGKARVRRDGVDRTITATELVKGDIVILETGDIIPADLRVLRTHDFLVDESVLTGESLQISKISERLEKAVDQPFQATNLVFKGTSVMSGTAEGVVVATGKDSEIGKISHIITETKKESAFQKNINRISSFVMGMVGITMLLLLSTHLILKGGGTKSFTDLIIFSIALTVGVIPEALPLVTTFSLSSGARKLAQDSVIVKRLTSVEDLGSVQVLCTDKTGTITENKLSVVDILRIDETADPIFIGSLAVTNIFEKQSLPNNAFDLSLVARLDETAKKALHDYRLVNELPFDPTRRRNSALVERAGARLLVVRGSPEEMVALDAHLDESQKKEILQWIVAQGKLGRRTLAISKEDYRGDEEYDERMESGHIHLCGIIAFVDELKPTTREVVERAHALGVRLVVLTGDDPVVAGAVGAEAGIIPDSREVMTGAAFDALGDKEKRQAVEKISVFARVSPTQKYEILQVLKEKHQVGFLGEGINDAPALKSAHVSLVVESAADIARETADIILLKQDLGVIIKGIYEGRKVFHNTVNYIRATLLSNFGNFYAVAFASLIIPYLPMLPVQLLTLNLLSDFPMFSISTDNVAEKDLQVPKNYNTREIIAVASLLGVVSTLFDFIIFSVFQRFGQAVLQTYWFIGSVATELVLLFSIRTNRIFYKAGTYPSRTILLMTLLALCTAVLLPFTAFGDSVFHFVRPSWNYVVVLALIVIGYFLCTEFVKYLYYHYLAKEQ